MDSSPKEKGKPTITVIKNGPYRVENVTDLEDSSGCGLPVRPIMLLCRCGASKTKPYCDGSHSGIRFAGDKDPNRVTGEVNEYVGKGITIVDNTDACCRDRSCITELPQVFETCDPDAADPGQIISTIRKCPSGALTYKLGGQHCQDFGREPAIIVVKNGPLKVVGGISLNEETGAKPACPEHYTLCRCGRSRNKPFCDGSHLDTRFQDDAH